MNCTRKKGFNGGYLADVNIILGIDLINGGNFNIRYISKFILKPQ